MSGQQLEMRTLLAQGEEIVTIESGQIPSIGFRDCNFALPCTWAVNFLRSGCPAVQMVQLDSQKSTWGNAEVNAQTIFDALQLGGEKFSFDNDESGRIMIVKRIVK